MCDYAVGLSRQLNGSIIPSERKTFFPFIISCFGLSVENDIICNEAAYLNILSC
jgi:hypothetical protein